MRGSTLLLALAIAACDDDPPRTPPPPPPIASTPAPLAVPAELPPTAPTTVPTAAAVEAPPPAATPDAEGWLHGTVAAGQSLSSIADKAGLSAAQAAALTAALAPVMDAATIREGQRWSLKLADDGVLAGFRFHRSMTTQVEVTRGADGTLVAQAIEAETTVEPFTLSATIDSSLWQAVTAAGGEPALVGAIVDVFASEIDFYTDPRKGDRVALVVERHLLGDTFVRYGDVLAAEYRGAQGTVRGLRWAPPGGEASWYTPAGHSLDRTLLKSPLKYARLSSGFNPKRMHPVLHKVKGHFGVDYAAPTGTPVWAAAGGEIVFRGEKGGAGNMVVLAHDGGFQTVYMHLSRFADGQKAGMKIAQKQVIGYVGTTGLSSGPHLHFGVKRSGRWIDPATVRAIERPGVAAKYRDAFARATKPLGAQLDALLAAPGGEATAAVAAP